MPFQPGSTNHFAPNILFIDSKDPLNDLVVI